MRQLVRNASTGLFGRSLRSLVVLALAVSLGAVVAPLSPARAADPVCTISAKLVNSCRPWLGAESGGYGASTFRASMLEHETRIGRQGDIVHEDLAPGDG